MKRHIATYAFIDASNLFYGGIKSLGWRIDYKKLRDYLKKKYNVSKIFYFGGVELYGFNHDYLKDETVPLNLLEKHLKDLLGKKKNRRVKAEILRQLQRIKFYKKLENFNYKLYIKPVKIYRKPAGSLEKKANCDADMTFWLMKEKENFERVIILSGDGDFLPVLKYLQNEQKKKVNILARAGRTAREIRQFAGNNFKDFEYLKYLLKMKRT